MPGVLKKLSKNSSAAAEITCVSWLAPARISSTCLRALRKAAASALCDPAADSSSTRTRTRAIRSATRGAAAAAS
jgi:hypothetical protein